MQFFGTYPSRLAAPRALFITVLALLAIAALGGCSETASTGQTAPEVTCAPEGLQSCFCPGGERSGAQQCLPDGTLTPCICAQSMAQPDDSAPVCAELQAASGCNVSSFQSEELPASILFVVDRSGSMGCNPPPLQDSASCSAEAVPVDANAPTRWSVTVDALVSAFRQLEGSDTAIGLSFFSNDDVCGVNSKPVVPVARADSATVNGLETILRTGQPAGGTPIVGAVTLGYQHMHEEAGAGIQCPGPECPCAAPPCGASGNRYVVLITDGEESCAADDGEQRAWLDGLLDDEAPQAVMANVRTFVVGAPGSEPSRGFLSELAFQGGTAKNNGQCQHDRLSSSGDCHFDMTATTDFAADFATVLDEIRGAAIGCEFAVPTPVDETSENTVNVQITTSGGVPVCIARDDTATCAGGANGWQFARTPDGSIDRSKVVLCGSACAQVSADAEARVDVLVGCQTILLE